MNPRTTDDSRCCPVVELRQYTVRPGRRNELIDLFDRHFVEGQEAVGMTVIGQFRDRRRPDRFVWLRGFPDMERRREALEAFYGGPVWGAHRDAANDTMLEFDDVLLLRPARPGTGFRVHPGDTTTSSDNDSAIVLAGIYPMPQPVNAQLVSQFEERVAPLLEAHDIRIEGVFVTEPARNTFPRLPVREGENVLVWVGILAGETPAHEWQEQLVDATILGGLHASLLELEPTPRSSLGGGRGAARERGASWTMTFPRG